MLVKVGSLDLTGITGYKVVHKDKIKEVESASGNTSVYVIAEKVEITIDLAAVYDLSPITAAMSSVTFDVQFLDTDGLMKTGRFKRNDRENGLMKYLNANPWWEESTLTLTSLGGVTNVTS